MKQRAQEFTGRPDQQIDRRVRLSKRLQRGILATVATISMAGGAASPEHENLAKDSLLIDLGLLIVAGNERMHAKKSTERMVEAYRRERQDRQLLPMANSNKQADTPAEELEDSGIIWAASSTMFSAWGSFVAGGMIEGKTTVSESVVASVMVLFALSNWLLQENGADQLQAFRHQQLEAIDNAAVAQLFKS